MCNSKKTKGIEVDVLGFLLLLYMGLSQKSLLRAAKYAINGSLCSVLWYAVGEHGVIFVRC